MEDAVFDVNRAVEEIARYEQVGPRQWRAHVARLVTASAEAATPVQCLTLLTKAVDAVLAGALTGTGPFAWEGDGSTARLSASVEELLLRKSIRD
jgi:hypothetical protein